MFSQIVNPKTNRKVNVNSRAGKEILNNYINNQSGGRVNWNHDRFRAGGHGATRQRSRAEIRVLDMLEVEYRGGNGAVQNYAAFWTNPNRRYHQFGYWNNRNRFYTMSLNEFIRDMESAPSDQEINDFIRMIELRFLDSRERALQAGENIIFHNHNDIIIGMLEAFWTLTEPKPYARLWLNRIEFLDISVRVAHDVHGDAVHWEDISRGLISSIMNYQLPDAYPGQAFNTYEEHQAAHGEDA